MQVEEELTKKNEGESKKMVSSFDMEGGGAMGGGGGNGSNGADSRRSGSAKALSEVKKLGLCFGTDISIYAYRG